MTDKVQMTQYARKHRYAATTATITTATDQEALRAAAPADNNDPAGSRSGEHAAFGLPGLPSKTSHKRGKRM